MNGPSRCNGPVPKRRSGWALADVEADGRPFQNVYGERRARARRARQDFSLREIRKLLGRFGRRH